MRPYRQHIAMSIAAVSLFVAACGPTTAAAPTPPNLMTAAPTASTAFASAPATIAAASAPTTAASTTSAPTPVAEAATPTTAAATASTTNASGTTPAATPTTAATVAPATPSNTVASNATSAPARRSAVGASSSTAAPISAGSTSGSATSVSETRYVIASGSTADYQAQEQLAQRNVPTTATGTTSGVTGAIVIGTDGKIDSSQSKIVVDLTTLQSDSQMRDGYVQRNILDTAAYPTATFVPTGLEGLSAPLSSSGAHTFQLIGNLTVRGVTKPATFSVTATANGNTVTGQGTTTVTFEEFGMTAPKTMMVLSVNDQLTLQVKLNLAASA